MVFVSSWNSTNAADDLEFYTATIWNCMLWEYKVRSRHIQMGQFMFWVRTFDSQSLKSIQIKWINLIRFWNILRLSRNHFHTSRYFVNFTIESHEKFGKCCREPKMVWSFQYISMSSISFLLKIALNLFHHYDRVWLFELKSNKMHRWKRKKIIGLFFWLFSTLEYGNSYRFGFHRNRILTINFQ